MNCYSDVTMISLETYVITYQTTRCPRNVIVIALSELQRQVCISHVSLATLL